MPYYIINNRIRFGTMQCKGVREADNVYLYHNDAQAVLDERELQAFYDKLSAGSKLSKRALCHINELKTSIMLLKAEANLQRERNAELQEKLDAQQNQDR